MKRKMIWQCLLVGMMMVTAACGGGRDNSTPSEVVATAFQAFQEGDNEGLNMLMSEQGLSNAVNYCGGEAIDCLLINYPEAGGEMTAYAAQLLEEGKETARVRLQTTWATWGTRCQSYQLDMTEEGWRISFFSEADKCPATE